MVYFVTDVCVLVVAAGAGRPTTPLKLTDHRLAGVTAAKPLGVTVDARRSLRCKPQSRQPPRRCEAGRRAAFQLRVIALGLGISQHHQTQLLIVFADGSEE